VKTRSLETIPGRDRQTDRITIANTRYSCLSRVKTPSMGY